MKRFLTVALLAATIALAPGLASASTPVVKACSQRAAGPDSVEALIRCAAPKMGISTSTATAIAWRESNYKPWAKNPSSSASGVYQVVSGTWAMFVRNYLYGHLLSSNVFNGRANVILSLRYVRHHGWGPWGS